MSYAIIGFGSIGQALARAFARNNIEVTVASRRPPEALLPQAQAIGPTVVPRTLQEALKADVIFLSVLFEGHREVAKNLASWEGKTIRSEELTSELPSLMRISYAVFCLKKQQN